MHEPYAYAERLLLSFSLSVFLMRLWYETSTSQSSRAPQSSGATEVKVTTFVMVVEVYLLIAAITSLRPSSPSTPGYTPTQRGQEVILHQPEES